VLALLQEGIVRHEGLPRILMVFSRENLVRIQVSFDTRDLSKNSGNTCTFPVYGDDDVFQRPTRGMSYWNDTSSLHMSKIDVHEKNDTAQIVLTMNSTMLMPKCSSTIVLRPMLALESQSSMTEYGAFTMNSTRDCVAID
jgi:hypothetical protein